MSHVPTVSVVTPVYNGERYLEECIRSIQAQTYQDWELLIVDNRSTDATTKIANEHASRDPRIRVLRFEEFVGACPNHNRALEAIDPRSRYCKMVHADDWLYPQCLELMVAVAERNPSVGVVSAYRLEGKEVLHGGLFAYDQVTLPGAEVMRQALSGPVWVTGSPSSLLYRADLIRATTPFFEVSFWHWDTEATYRTLLRSDIGFVHQVMTFTRLHPGALTSYSHRVNTYISHEGRMLVRYGPHVFDETEYRRKLRNWLRRYSWYLVKQRMKPSRFREVAYHRFHRSEIGHIRAELGEERAIAAGLGLCRLFLSPAPSGSGTPTGAAA
jgi:glycosyltransferase involved in cell wall biosynthesis